MERVNGVLTITKDELIASSIVSDSNLEKLVSRKTLQIVVRGCRGRQAQYAVDTLPEKYKAEVYKRFDIPPMDRVKSLLEQLIRPLPEAVSYYHSYRLGDGRCLPSDKIAQYTAEAQILEAVSVYQQEHYSKRGKAGRRPMGKGELYCRLADMIQALPQEEYPHKLPKSRLQEKHEAYQRDGYESLIHKGYQNQNASKTGSDEQSALLLMLLASPNNLNNSQVHGSTTRPQRCVAGRSSPLRPWGRSPRVRAYSSTQGARVVPTTACRCRRPSRGRSPPAL